MRTNADLTIYHRAVDPATRGETWTRSQVRGVYWSDRKAANVLRAGRVEADQASVYIPMDRGPISIQPDDVIVKGLVSDEITSGFTISALKRKYPHVLTVRSIDTMDAGAPHMRHWQVGAG